MISRNHLGTEQKTEIGNVQVSCNGDEIVCLSMFLELAVSLLCREPRKRYKYGENICLIYENQAQKGFVKLSITAFLL